MNQKACTLVYSNKPLYLSNYLYCPEGFVIISLRECSQYSLHIIRDASVLLHNGFQLIELGSRNSLQYSSRAVGELLDASAPLVGTASHVQDLRCFVNPPFSSMNY